MQTPYLRRLESPLDGHRRRRHRHAGVLAVLVSVASLTACGSSRIATSGETAATPAPTLAPLTSTTTPPTTQPPATTIQPTAFTACPGGNSIAAPSAPHGVFAIVFTPVTPAQSAILAKNVIPDATNCGATINVRWSDIDKGAGATPQYDWSSVDAVAAPWLAAQKVVNLAFEGVGEGSKGAGSTPASVLSKVRTVDCNAPNTPAHNPVYWDPVYQDAFRAFQFAAVAHANSMDGIGYLRFGIGSGTEDYTSPGYGTSTCKKAWLAAGLTPTQWLSFSISQVDFQAQLQSAHPLVVSLNTLDPGDTSVPDAVAAEATKLGIGIGSQSLTKSDQASAAKSAPCPGNWCASFGRSAASVPLFLQTSTATDPAGRGVTGDLGSVALFGLSQKAQIFELYPDEWTLANDITAPGYSKYHQSQHDVLVALAHAVG